MTADEVKQLVEQGIEGAQVQINGEGDRFDILVVADAFDGLMPVKKQQLVYACINDRIAAGDIHAVSIKAYTPEAWETAQRRGLI